METDIFVARAINFETLEITPKFLSIIAALDEFKGAWRAIGRLAPERLSSLQRVATIESTGASTRIEGAKLSNLAVETLLANIDIQSFANRDEQEVASYAETMEMIFADYEAIDLTENHIKQLHRDVLRHTEKDGHHRGNYKTLANNVEAFDAQGVRIGVVFETATPFDTPRLMGELVGWTRHHLSEGRLHPLLIIAVFTVVFLEIHPFQDGNGRLSRILTTLLMLRSGYAYVPFSSLESIIEVRKEGYYRALRQTQETIRGDAPDWQPWCSFFLEALQEQKRQLERRIDQEIQILGAMPELSSRILQVAQQRGRVTVANVVALTGASRNTVKDHLKSLVKAGHLVRKGAGRGTWYAPV